MAIAFEIGDRYSFVYRISFISGKMITLPKDDVPEGGWKAPFSYYGVPAGGFFDGFLDIMCLFEYFSTSHTAVANGQMLWNFFEKAKTRTTSHLRLPTAVIDFSWPLMTALNRVLNDQSNRLADTTVFSSHLNV